MVMKLALTLREEHGLRALENRALRRVSNRRMEKTV
jgi:hypothetical protein